MSTTAACWSCWRRGDGDDGDGSLLGDIVSGVGVLLAGAGIGWAWLKSLRAGKKADADLAAKAVTKANAARSAEMASRVSAAESEVSAAKSEAKASRAQLKNGRVARCCCRIPCGRCSVECAC